MQRFGFIVIGIIFLVYNVVLRLFVIVCAIFATVIMIGLMTQWFKALLHLSKKRAA